MKSLIFIPFALLAGMLIGSWAPRSDVARLQDELNKANRLLKKQPERARTINEVTSLLGIERSSNKPAKPAQKNTSEEISILGASRRHAPIRLVKS